MKILITSFLLLLTSLLLFLKDDDVNDELIVKETKKEVVVTKLIKKNFEKKLKFSGFTEASRTVILKSQVEGKISSKFFEKGRAYKDTGGLLIIDYGSYEIKFKNTIKAIYKQKSSNFLKNIGKSDITHHINYNLFNTVVKNFKGLTSNYTTQKKFLSNLGIFHRAEILSKNKTFSQKADIFYRVKRLIDENQMGNLFKVMLIKNIKNKSKVGF